MRRPRRPTLFPYTALFGSMRLSQQRAKAETVRTSLAAFCARIRSRLDGATFDDKQAILQLVIERIVVGDGRLEIRHVIPLRPDRKSTRLNSSHANISYAVF